MSTYFAILTQVGEAKLANAIALGQTLKLKKMGVGDGNGALPIPDRLQKALVHEVRRADLNQLAIDPANPSQIIAEQVLPEEVGGWWIREIGLYDEAGDLCAVANCPPSYKPVMAEGSARTQVVRVVLIVASTAAIELKIDPSVVLATRRYADEQDIEVRAEAHAYADTLLAQHLVAPDPHPQYKPKELAMVSKSVAGKVDVVLTEAEALADVLHFTGALTGNINVIVPGAARSWTVRNKTTGAFTLTFKTANGSGLTIGQGQTRAPYCDGVDVLSRISEVNTAPQFDDSTRIASTAFVRRIGLQAAALYILGAGTTKLTPADVGKTMACDGGNAPAVTLPTVALCPPGSRLEFFCGSTHQAGMTINTQGGDLLGMSSVSVATITLLDGDTLTLESNGVGAWLAVGGSVQLRYSSMFSASLAPSGHQRLPSGHIRQWGVVGSVPQGGSVYVAFPIAFPREVFVVIPAVAGQGVASPTPFSPGASTPSLSGVTLFNNGSNGAMQVAYEVTGK